MKMKAQVDAYFNAPPYDPNWRYPLIKRFSQKPGLLADLTALTDNSGGTASGTLAAITSETSGAASSYAETRNAIASLAARVNSLAVLDRDFIVSGTNMTTALATLADNGGLTLTTAGTSGDEAYLSPNTNAGQSAWASAKWNSSDEPAFKAIIKTGSTVALTTIHAGLKLTVTGTVATDADQAYFRYNPSENGGKWQAIVSRDGTDDTAIPLGDEAVAAETVYELCVAVDSSRRSLFYINGTLWHIHQAPLKADVDLKPNLGVKTGEAVLRSIKVFEAAISKLPSN
jgi:hypothetical protein